MRVPSFPALGTGCDSPPALTGIITPSEYAALRCETVSPAARGATLPFPSRVRLTPLVQRNGTHFQAHASSLVLVVTAK